MTNRISTTKNRNATFQNCALLPSSPLGNWSGTTKTYCKNRPLIKREKNTNSLDSLMKDDKKKHNGFLWHGRRWWWRREIRTCAFTISPALTFIIWSLTLATLTISSQTSAKLSWARYSSSSQSEGITSTRWRWASRTASRWVTAPFVVCCCW